MNNESSDLPGDFTPVDGCVPDWIDIPGVCGESPRFVGLYPVNGFNVIAINNGKTIYTTNDRNGEFRRRVEGLTAAVTAPLRETPEHDKVLVYDCEEERQWLAPRTSAVQFLYRQN